MNNRNYDCIIIISVISGLFITTCDYLVQMKTVETDYFVSRLLSLEETILNLSSFGCIFTFPFWILGTYFIYTTMCKVNKKLALINTFCISYSLLMLGFYHYSYAIIYSIGTSKMIMQTNIDWQLLTGSNIPFFPFMFILLPVTWLIVGFSNFSSKAIVPRWSIVCLLYTSPSPLFIQSYSSSMVYSCEPCYTNNYFIYCHLDNSQDRMLTTRHF